MPRRNRNARNRNYEAHEDIILACPIDIVLPENKTIYGPFILIYYMVIVAVLTMSAVTGISHTLIS